MLLSAEDVTAARLQDHYTSKLKRNEELLRQAALQADVIGYKAAAPFAQPIMKEKLEGMQVLGDVHASYCEDQRRWEGHSEVYLEELSVGGQITAMAPLDKAHLACASTHGHLWVYNWRENRVISQLRSSSVVLADEDGNPEVCKVRRMQALTQDGRILGSTDERGMVCLWDLFDLSMIAESRFHEKACTSIKPDYWRQSFCTTGEDSAVILYDLAQEQVRERLLPPPRSCGNGIPNTCLGIGGDRFPNLLVTGGADGKLRIFDQSASLKRLHTISVGSVLPTQCFAIDWQLVVSASLGDSSYTGQKADRGGVYCYDLRMLAEGYNNRSGALVVKYPSGVKDGSELKEGQSSMRSSMKSSRSRGSNRSAKSTSAARQAMDSGIGGIDLAIVEEGNSKLAVSLMDNVVKAFDLGTGEEIQMAKDLEVKRKTQLRPPYWEIDTSEVVENDYATSCVMTAIDRYVFVGSTAPSLQIWRRPLAGYRGHCDYVPPPLQPLELRQRCLPLALNAHDVPDEALLADPTLRPGYALANARKGLELDRTRCGMTLRDFSRPNTIVEGVA